MPRPTQVAPVAVVLLIAASSGHEAHARPSETPAMQCMVGRVLGDGGSRVRPGTRIIAMGRLRPAIEQDAPRLRYETELRPSGRFALQLPREGRYSVWAESRLPNGSVEYSSIASDVRSAARPTLSMLGRPTYERRLRIRGLDAWTRRGPLELRVRPRAAHLAEQACQRHSSGAYVVPALPGRKLEIHLYDGEGQRIEAWTVDQRPGHRVAHTVELGAPRRAILELVDEQTGRRIPAATLHYECARKARARWGEEHVSHPPALAPSHLGYAGSYEAGATLIAEFPGRRTQGRPEPRMLHVWAAGYVMQRVPMPRRDLGSHRAAPAVLRIALRPALQLHGRIQDSRRLAIAGLLLLHRGGPGAAPSLTQTDEEGQYRFDHIRRGSSGMILALPGPEQRKRMTAHLGAKQQRGMPQRAIEIWSGATRLSAGLQDLGTSDSRELRVLRLRVQRPNGTPARHAQVLLSQDGQIRQRLIANGNAEIQALLRPRAAKLLAYEDTSSLPCSQELEAEQFYAAQAIALPLSSIRR